MDVSVLPGKLPCIGKGINNASTYQVTISKLGTSLTLPFKLPLSSHFYFEYLPANQHGTESIKLRHQS